MLSLRENLFSVNAKNFLCMPSVETNFLCMLRLRKKIFLICWVCANKYLSYDDCTMTNFAHIQHAPKLSSYSSLFWPWTCLFYSRLCYPWTCLFYSWRCCLDASVMRLPVLPLDMSVYQQPVLALDVAVIREQQTFLFYYSRLCCLLMCMFYSNMYWPWTCLLCSNLCCPLTFLLDSSLFWPWACMLYSNLRSSWRVCLTAACPGPGRVCYTAICATPGGVCWTAAYTFIPGVVWSTASCGHAARRRVSIVCFCAAPGRCLFKGTVARDCFIV
jgi:hypothetical protein